MTNEPNLDHLDIMTALRMEADLQVILDRYVAYGNNREVIYAVSDLSGITGEFDAKIHLWAGGRLDARTVQAQAAHDADRDARWAQEDVEREARYLVEASAEEVETTDTTDTTDASPIKVTNQLKTSIAFLRVGTIGISRIMEDLDKGEMNESEALHAVEFERKAIDHRIDELEKMVGIAA